MANYPKPEPNSFGRRHAGIVTPNLTWWVGELRNAMASTFIQPGHVVGTRRTSSATGDLIVQIFTAGDDTVSGYSDARTRIKGVAMATIAPGTTNFLGSEWGPVMLLGRVTNLLVTGTVAAGDKLQLSGIAGVAESLTSATQVRRGYAFATAEGTNSGGLGRVTAFIGERF